MTAGCACGRSHAPYTPDMAGVAGTRRWAVWLFAAATAVFVLDAAVELTRGNYLYAARQLVGAAVLALLAVEQLRWPEHRPLALKSAVLVLAVTFVVLLLVEVL